jgi:hypothetical protein
VKQAHVSRSLACNEQEYLANYRRHPPTYRLYLFAVVVVHGGLLVARGKGKVWDNSLYSITGLLLTTVWLPLCCPSAFFQAA